MITATPILLDGKNTAFGGRIIDASVNIEFSAASSFSISIVSDTGLYSITEASLRAGGDPMVLKIGDKEFKIFPVSYTVENSEGIKTLKVEFLDSSVKHLDKKFVLLKGTHITSDNINNPDVDMSWIIAVGTPYEVQNSDAGETLIPVRDIVDENGYIVSGYGMFSQDVVVYYSLITLLNSLGALIDEEEKNKVRASLSALYADEYNDGLGFVSKTRERDFVGTVREVLASWGEEIGLIFYWDPATEKIKTMNPNDPISSDEVALAVERMGECSCKSSSTTHSIQNNVLEGNIIIGSEGVKTDARGGRSGGSSPFKLLNPWEAVSLFQYTESVDDENRQMLTVDMLSDGGWLTGINKLMKAAAAGEDFYLGYILHTLAVGYDDIKEWAYERKSNPVVNFLYGGAFEVLAQGACEASGIDVLRSSVTQGIFDGIRHGDKEYFSRNTPILLFRAINRMIKPPTNLEEVFNDINRMERDSLDNLVQNTSEERIFQTLKVLAENYNRWYYSTKLVTNMKYSFRNYEKSSSWNFHGLDTYDSPIAPLITVRDKNRSTSTEYTSTQTAKIPFKGEARGWQRELPPNSIVNPNNEYINCDDGPEIIATGTSLNGCEHFKLVGVTARENISEFVYDDATLTKLTTIFGASATHAAFGSSYSNLLDLRQGTGYEIEENKDYGVVLIDSFAGTNGLAANFSVSVAAPPVKEVQESTNQSVAILMGADTKYCLYVRGKFDYEKFLTGLPDIIKPVSASELTEMYNRTYSFSYSYNGPAGGASDTDDEGNEIAYFAKGVSVPKSANSYVQHNVSIQDMSFADLLSVAGKRVRRSVDLEDVKAFASNWAKKLSINDPEPQYSQQITFVGIPESIPSVAEGLEGLSISVDENGISTQVSVGSRKIKREIFEKRQRMINESKYRAERSRMTLIPNGRFSTRFLAGTQL